MEFRKPTKSEADLIVYMIELAGNSVSLNYPFIDIRVATMEDGGMGSLYITKYPELEPWDSRTFGACVSEYQFFDIDDVPILVSLNVDENNELYELDVWKADFSPVKKFPNPHVEG